ncbi:MAG TPA: phospholipase [Rikenellaceae bacterium]|nr:phospholipase [Rikenellaceae bacterium]
MEYKYKLGLALSGGGVKGFAHAGALKALEEAGIRPDVIAGTSAGAIVAALYSAGHSPDEICSLFKGRYFNDFVELNIPKNGFFGISGFSKFLKKNICYKTFEELPIPIYVVATDLDNGRSITFSSGELHKKIIASACVPVVFNPIEIDGIHYVDGGIFKNFPVSVIRDKCETIIGINASPLSAERYSKNIVGIAERTYHFMFRANTVEDKKMCDIVVEVENVMQFRTFDLQKVDVIFEMGYKAMKNSLEVNSL